MIDYMDPGPPIAWMPYSQEVQRRPWENPGHVTRRPQQGEFLQRRPMTQVPPITPQIPFEALDTYLRNWAAQNALNLWQAGWGGQELEDRQWQIPQHWWDQTGE